MKFLLEFDDYKSRESKTRTKPLGEQEFLEIFKTNCKNFLFSNDQLWRGTNDHFGKLGLYLESERKRTIGNYNYKDFFDVRKNYLVPRYKSLIGSTEKDGAEYLSSEGNVYLVIPFDESNIVFAGSPDLAWWSKKGQEFTDELFVLEQYTKDFKVPTDKLWSILSNSKLKGFEDTFVKRKLGFEFFTNSNCLLLSVDKVDWLKGIIE
jgi:hypothetical protein